MHAERRKGESCISSVGALLVGARQTSRSANLTGSTGGQPPQRKRPGKARPYKILVLFFMFLTSLGERHNLYAEVLEPEKIKVAATIFPIGDIARQIGREMTEVIVILPPQANPHTFEFRPHMIRKLEHVRAIFVVGHGFDDWLIGAYESLPQARKVMVGEGVQLIDEQGVDPHYWLSISTAKVIARNIANALATLYPERRETFEVNVKSYVGVLEETDREIERLFADLETRKMVTYHNAWRYFAKDYGLQIVGTVEHPTGGEPTPKHLMELAKSIQESEIKVLFLEPTASRSVAESFAQDFGLKLYELDPIGGPFETSSYHGMTLENARVIQKALGHG